jgi:hypothetical protein
MSDLSFEILVSLGLSILGIVSIACKRISIGIGRPRPLVDATLTGDRAVLFGVISLIAGIAPIVLILYSRFKQDESLIEQGLLSIVMGAGGAIVFLTFTFEFFIEFLVALRDRDKK